MLIDSHAHLDFDRFDQDRVAVLERARCADVAHIITIGTHLKSSQRAIDLACTYSGFISASVGFHPLSLEDDTEEGWQILRTLAEREEVCAIGETGLDYYYNSTPHERQRSSFRHHLQLSAQIKKPIIVHIRDAFEDVFTITKEEGIPSGGVVHCFTGGVEECLQALTLGYHISLSGIVTFKSAHSLRQAIPHIPLDRLLLETDAPFLAPSPHRGTRNEPAFVQHTAKFVAQLLGLSFEELCAVTTLNTVNLFHLPYPIRS